MKKIIKFIITIAALFIITTSASCNQQVFDFNYSFPKAYVKIGEEWVDLEIKTWTDYEGEQLQLTLTDGTVLVVNSVNCVLYNGNLPCKR